MSWLWLARADALRAFEDPEIRDSLPRYIEVSRDRLAAQFLIARSIEVDRPRSEEEAWEIHAHGIEELLEIAKSDASPSEMRSPEGFTLLDLKIELAEGLASRCRLCERSCGVDRKSGERGVCGVGWTPRVASAFVHMGEEAPITPSGTVFFSGCNFKCVFCQNWDISQFPGSGEPVGPEELCRLFEALRSRGVRNINLVGGEPTPNLHAILKALRILERNVPIVWNSNMYMSREATELLLGVVDLWLPDFKYWENSHAAKYSGVPRYREVVTRNLKRAYGYWPEMVIRHLVMPGHVECCTLPILSWIAENTPRALVNVMSQYRPEYRAREFEEISRRPSFDEMRRAYEEADRLGLRWRSVS